MSYTNAAMREPNDNPLRRVVSHEMHKNYRLDHLECGHSVQDFNCYPLKKRRRCAQCGEETNS